MEEDTVLIPPDSTEPRPGCFQRLLNLFRSKEEGTLDVSPVPFSKLFRFATRAEFVLYALASLLSALAGLMVPIHIYIGSRLTTLYVEEKAPIGNDEFLLRAWRYGSLFFFSFLVAMVIEYAQHYLLTWASERIVARCRSAFIAAVLSRDSSEHNLSTGELSNQLTSHIDRIKECLGEKVGYVTRTIATFFSCFILSLILDWQTALLLFWSGPAHLLTAKLIPKLSEKANARTLQVSEEASGVAEESILNVKTIASCNGQKQITEKYSSILASGVGASIRVALTSGFLEGVSLLLYAIFNNFGLWWATISYHNGRVASAGDVIAVVFVSIASSSSFSDLGPQIIDLTKARVAAAKVYKTIDSAKTDDETSTEQQKSLDPSRAEMHLRFDDVSFAFPSRAQAVLRNLNFDLAPGQSLALVGRSGCGKSTTLKLLTRFLDVDSGRILLDGVPLEHYDKKKWRQMLGVVSQEPCLFNGSIRENICLGRPYSQDQIEDTCKIAYAHDFIKTLEKGYDSLLGPSGVSLSGGQKQRIAIARAIVSNPRLLMLDEATSALDSRSERIVQEALDRASAGRSTIIVAHRLSTIRSVDRVIVMEEGEIVESGGFDELRTKEGGKFAQMLRDQEVERVQMHEDNESDEEKPAVPTHFEEESTVHEVPTQEFATLEGGLWAVLNRNKGKTAVVFLLGILLGLTKPLLAGRFFFVFGTLEDDDYQRTLIWLIVFTAVTGVYNSLLRLIVRPLNQYIGETVMNGIRVDCLRSLLSRPMAYFDRQETSPSACSVLLSQQAPLVISMIDRKLCTIVSSVFAATVILTFLFATCWPNGIVGLLYLSSYTILLIIFEKLNDRANRAVVETDKSAELAVEIFDTVATIQQLAVEDHFQNKFDEILKKRESPLNKRIKCQSFVNSTNESIYLLFNFLATAFGVYYVYLGYFTTQQLFTAETFVSHIGYLTYDMSFSFKAMIESSSASKLLFALIDPAEEKTSEDNKPLEVSGAVHGESLSFNYPSNPRRRVLNDVSFGVEAGRSLAFVGPSGGGKSTIVNLLERFYEPNAGTLYLDSTAFPSIAPSTLRSRIALVGQEPVLFRGTIADNVRLGVDGVSDEAVREACRLANAAEFVQDFPEGYSTLVGEKGRSLSGGQKQRIAIARALVRNPAVILLDEATSALDTLSEKVVRAALASSAIGRTSITIAHRLDTIRHCDEIFFVEGGRIVERGNHDELMERRGHYYAMTAQQTIN